MAIIPEVSLGTGSMPLIGMGTAAYPFEVSDTTREAVLQAIELGYRHFDTAMIYQSEQPLGESIAEALRLGLIASRDELFITSKLWCADAHGDLVVPALQKTLKNLQLEYLDLYLIHCGWSLKRGYYSLSIDPKDYMVLDIKSVWEGMEQCKRLGLTKAIGVSNFTQKKITQLLATAKIPPAVNQVEMNPLWQQKKMREFCKTRDIHVTAYSPLGAKGTPWGMNDVMESDVLKEIANDRGKSIAQVCLRWVYEQGVSVVVKSFNKERMKENLQILDWELTKEESHKIARIPQCKGFLGKGIISPDGAFKSFSDLWDGEL